MEVGFTQNSSKGLFTFYREQGEITYKKERKKMKTEAEEKSSRRQVVSLHHEAASLRKPYSVIESPTNISERYKDKEGEEGKGQVYRSRHVFSLNFNPQSPRKSGHYLQLLAGQRRAKLDRKSNSQASGQLSVRQLGGKKYEQLFQHKRDYLGKIAPRKHPLRMRPVAPRALQPNQQGICTRGIRQLQDQRRFHMPLIVQLSAKHAREKARINLALFKQGITNWKSVSG